MKRKILLTGIISLSMLAGIFFAFFPTQDLVQAEYESWLAVPGTNPQLFIRPGHPRIAITPDNLPNLKCRAGILNNGACPSFGSASAIYQNVKGRFDGFMQEQQARTDQDIMLDMVPAWALLYQITGNASYCDLPKRKLLYDASVATPYSEQSRVLGLAYDWCYATFSSQERTTIGQYLLTLNQTHPYNPGVQNHLVWSPEIFYPFALFGDSFTGNDDTFTGNQIKLYVEDGYQDKWIPGHNAVGCDGGIDGYGGTRTSQMRWAAELFTTATSYQTMFQDSLFLENSALFYINKLRGDMGLSRNPAKWNTFDTYLPGFMSQFAARYNDPYAQWMANYYVDQQLYDYRDDILRAWEVLLWDDPSRFAQPISSLPTVRRGTCSGMNYMRSDWDFGANSQTIFSAFFNGPDTQNHKTQNHFLISRGDDSLLIDSGYRAGDLDWSYGNYYTRTIAHNALTIFDPNENFGIDPFHPGYNLSNDGGQCSSGPSQWPDAPGVGYRGEITHFEDAPGYTYFEGDATPAYRTTKTNQVERVFLNLKPDIFVVFDRVNSLNPSFPKRSLLHMVEKPLVDGLLTTNEGSIATGGIFTSTDSNLVTVKYGDSAVLSRILLPENKFIRIIGGQNIYGDSVRQNFIPSYALTYSPSQSYEFYVNGRLYTPGPDYYNAERIYNRNSEVGNETGDWRVEVEPAVSQNYDTFLNVMQVKEGDLFQDEEKAVAQGYWNSAYYAHGYGFFKNDAKVISTGSSENRLTWTFTVPQTGNYEVFVWLPKKNATLDQAAVYTITHAAGSSNRPVNQDSGRVEWVSLGTYSFNAGSATVMLTSSAAEGMFTIADAVKLVRTDTPLSMVPAQLITSSNNNMQGAFINDERVVMFSRDGTLISTTTFDVNANGSVSFLLFNMQPGAGYNVNLSGQTITVSSGGSQYYSSNQGTLIFTKIFDGGFENHAPVITPIGTQITRVNKNFSLNITATDADNDRIYFTAVQKPAWLTLIDNADNTATLIGKPSKSDLGTNNVAILASDGELTASAEFTIKVIVRSMGIEVISDPIPEPTGGDNAPRKR